MSKREFTVTITPKARAQTIEMLLTNGTPEGVQDAREMLLELCQLLEHYENNKPKKEKES